MPGGNCAVACCGNYFSKTKGLEGDSYVAYFRFPKDPKLRKQWISACHRKDDFNANTAFICSEHFLPEDMQRNMMAEMGFAKKKPCLVENSIPTQKLLPGMMPKEKTQRQMRKEEKERQAIIQDLCTESEISMQLPEPDEYPCEESLLQRYNNLQQEYDNLKVKYDELQKESLAKITALENEVKRFQENVNSEAKKILAKCFTPSQIKVLLSDSKRVKEWTSEDLSVAFSLRYLSKKCYMFLRTKLSYPLPGISTLQKWANLLNMKTGILHDVLRIMEMAAHKFRKMERVTILSFDETKICEDIQYDQSSDEVIGPCKQLQVVMARGLFASWKQPLFVGFDCPMTPDILTGIVDRLQTIGYHSVALVNDCGPTNRSALRQLGVVEGEGEPIKLGESPIFCFLDTPHLLKLLRNHFVDKGFILGDGTLITTKPLRSLIVASEKLEVSSLHKLSMKHLEVDRQRRQNVRLAAELISHTTATALRHYDASPDSQAVADFLDLSNDFFDLLNSRSPKGLIPTKVAYGIFLDQQDETLAQYQKVIEEMRVVGHKNLLPFQKGILTNLKLLRKLFTYVRGMYDVKFILTYKLNQDCLENLFSQLRERGGLNDHPAPLDALQRLRMMILGTNPGVISKNANVDNAGEEEFMTRTVIRQTLPALHQHKASVDLGNDIPAGPSRSQITDKKENTLQEEMNQDGLRSLAGWVAKKFKGKYPELGFYTYKAPKSDHDYQIPSWISHLSYGGLTEPSPEWKEAVLKMEEVIQTVFGAGILKTRPLQTIMGRLQAISSQYPPEVIKEYVLERINIRVRFLNAQKTSEKLLLQRKKKFKKM